MIMDIEMLYIEMVQIKHDQSREIVTNIFYTENTGVKKSRL